MDSSVCDCCFQWVHLKHIGKKTMPKGNFLNLQSRLSLRCLKYSETSIFLLIVYDEKHDFNMCSSGGKDFVLKSDVENK